MKHPRVRIHVNQHVIRRNKTHGESEPPIGVEYTSGKVPKEYCSEVVIHGPSKLVYSPDKPLKCGARLWLETDALLTVTGAKFK